jgi:hypothetical protein
MTGRYGSKAGAKAHMRRLPRTDPRARLASLLMLGVFCGMFLLGIALLIFVLRDLWVFIATMMQP